MDERCTSGVETVISRILRAIDCGGDVDLQDVISALEVVTALLVLRRADRTKYEN